MKMVKESTVFVKFVHCLSYETVISGFINVFRHADLVWLVLYEVTVREFCVLDCVSRMKKS